MLRITTAADWRKSAAPHRSSCSRCRGGGFFGLFHFCAQNHTARAVARRLNPSYIPDMASTTAAVCALCSGSGWKAIPGEAGEPRYTRCDCVRAGRGERLLENARIPARYAHCDFREFAALNDTLRAAKLTADAFVREYDPAAANDGL